MPMLQHPIYLPADLLEALAERTGHFWSTPENEAIVVDAVRALLKPAPAAPAQQQPAARFAAGYQWKQVFLPEGTRLRASFGRQPYFAVVEGAEIKYGERAISPSCFANLQGSGNRNAWKAVWLCFPGSDEWLLADICRSARQAAIARMFGDDLRKTRQRSHAASPKPQGNGKRQSGRSGAGRAVTGERSAAPNKPAAGRFVPRLTDTRPQNGPGFILDDGARNKNATRRDSRRRRRAAKHILGNS